MYQRDLMLALQRYTVPCSCREHAQIVQLTPRILSKTVL